MARRTKSDFDDEPQRNGVLASALKWLFVLAIWGGIVLSGVLLWYGKDLIALTKKSNFERKRSVVVLAMDGQTMLANYGETSGNRVKVTDLPDYVGDAVLAIEDRRFHYHFGVDPIGLLRAAVTNFTSGRVVQGGSTVTQQLAKNLFLKPERKFKRKIQEAILAVWLETKYTKEEILSAYLNRVYFGSGAYGIDAAAHVYFDKPATQLTLEEAAMLAGLLKAPAKLSPDNNPDAAINRMNMVLEAMEDAGFLEAKKKEKHADGRPVPPRKPINLHESNTGNRYFTDWVLDRANDLIGVSGADLTIVTTLDAKLQRATADAAKKSLDEFFKDPAKQPQVAVIAMERDGAIRSMLGGRNYRESQFNRATQAMRQPGSAFKAFVYLAALEKGVMPGDPIIDAPINLGGYAPTNHDGQYHGEVPMTSAFALSLNAASVNLAANVGIASVVDVAHRAGIVSDLMPTYSLALGASEVTPLEMASAYNTIASYGVPTVPYGIISIRDGNNDIIYQHESVEESAVLDPGACRKLLAMMQEVVTRGTGGRAYPGFMVAGKTGTSSDYKDTWFMGVSPVITAAVWVGFDDNRSMHKQYGGNAPADIFRQVAAAAQAGRPITALTGEDPYAVGLGTAISNNLGGVFNRLFGEDGATSQPLPAAQQPGMFVPSDRRMKPIMDGPTGFND